MGVRDFTIYDYICQNSEINADSDCIVYDNTRLSFRDFKVKCDQLAAGLTKAGIKKGDRMGVVAQNSDEYLILYGAAAKLGAIILTVNWRFQKDEVSYVLSDCTPKIVFAGQDFQDTVIESISQIPSVEMCYFIGQGTAKDGFSPFADLYSEEGSDTNYDVSADDGFVIIHTAAVEGKPRGALLSHANIVYNNLLTILEYKLGTDDCFIGFLPFFHVAGLCMALAIIHAGGKNVVLDRFDPELTLKLIEREKGTIMFNFAPILGMIMDKYDEGSYDISSMKHVSGLDSGENIQRFMNMVPGCMYYTGFAQTEAMGVSRGKVIDRPGSAGKPSALCRVKLFNDYDVEVPVGTPGEICVQGPTVFLGYWGLEEDTAHTLRNGWHHTGDIGRFDEDGFLWYVKRKAQKELIKPGGENVYPVEVEKTILEHQNVAEVSVIGVPDPKWGEAIKAVCVLASGKSLEAEELIEFVGSKIARYKKPQQVVFVDALPKKEDGTIDRDQVKKDHGAKY